MAFIVPAYFGEEWSRMRLVFSIAVSSLAAVFVAPLCGMFPPVAAFLCRMTCPEAFYFLRPGNSGRGKQESSAEGGSPIKYLSMLSCALVALLALVMLIEGCSLLSEWGLRAFTWLLFVLPVALVAALVVVLRGRALAPGRVERIVFLAYHGLEILFWTSFWLVAIGWCFTAGS
ncbi:MAG: hypothetical protein HFJ72_06015 [Adlercreutzia sp.]|nr:hypothetical protein [Adlercreutzia sp.]